MTCLDQIYSQLGGTIPAGLVGWDEMVGSWCEVYSNQFSGAVLSEINLGCAAFLFDHFAERVILGYAASTPQLMARDHSRMRGFPDVNVGVRARLGESAFHADRGHFLGHASGGELDINLFPHRRELNRGWSPEGKRFRAMEEFVAEHPGVFFYHRPIYDDSSWIPALLEYGVLVDDRWWCDSFRNK